MKWKIAMFTAKFELFYYQGKKLLVDEFLAILRVECDFGREENICDWSRAIIHHNST